ncbi:MAG: hypothetical protein EXQ85_02325 [Alphaproteobacteria bacterium]|nr:hypothetical protein [Alphaproteobacteria bacterium]
MKWIARSRPKIDRIACPWLIQRFIDPVAEFLFVPGAEVLATAAREDAIPFDVPGVELGHVGELCSFDAFLGKYRLGDPALHELARIVRGADTGRPDLAPESAGLLAISEGLGILFADDHTVIGKGMTVYDALLARIRARPAGRPGTRAIVTLARLRVRFGHAVPALRGFHARRYGPSTVAAAPPSRVIRRWADADSSADRRRRVAQRYR